MNTSDVLNKAADLIEERGWWSPSSCGGRDPKCAANAILHSTTDGRLIIAADYALSQYLVGRDDLPAIWNWNDAPGRTKSEVIEALRAAAVIAASRETSTATQPSSEAVSQ